MSTRLTPSPAANTTFYRVYANDLGYAQYPARQEVVFRSKHPSVIFVHINGGAHEDEIEPNDVLTIDARDIGAPIYSWDIVSAEAIAEDNLVVLEEGGITEPVEVIA